MTAIQSAIATAGDQFQKHFDGLTPELQRMIQNLVFPTQAAVSRTHNDTTAMSATQASTEGNGSQKHFDSLTPQLPHIACKLAVPTEPATHHLRADNKSVHLKTTPLTTDTFQRLFDRLTPELQFNIYNFTFSRRPNTRHVTPNCKPANVANTSIATNTATISNALITTNSPIIAESPITRNPPITTKAPSAKKVLITTKTSMTGKTPITAKPPKTTKTQITTKTPVTTKSPIISKTTLATESPITPEFPIVTTPPTITEPSLTTETPYFTNTSTTTEIPVSTDDFQRHFNALPPELRNMIEDLTFCAGPTPHHINETYKVPSALHVSRATRAKFAQSHYTLTTFKTFKQGTLRRWLRSIVEVEKKTNNEKYVHVNRIQNVHFDLKALAKAQEQDMLDAEDLDGAQPSSEEKSNLIDVHNTQSTKKTQPANTDAHQKDIQAPKNFHGAKSSQAPKPERLDGKPSRMRRNNDANYRQKGKASFRYFVTPGYLRKRNLHLRNGALKFNVQFDGMDEEIWTPNPKKEFTLWKEAKGYGGCEGGYLNANKV